MKSSGSLLDRKVAFARKHWSVMGEPFEIEDGGWLMDNYWRPLHSLRLAAIDKSALCQDCAADAGQLVEAYARPGCRHKAKDCAGLRCEPIQFVLLDLPRRSGKTAGTSGFVGAALFRGEGERIGFISGSEDQSGRLFADHYRSPITRNPALMNRARITGTMIQTWKTASDMRKNKPANCQFDFMSTSISGTTGGKFSVLVIDEARAVPGDIAMALIPATFDQNGWQCPIAVVGHTKTKGDLDDPNHPEKCAACGSWLHPYTGKVLAMSSAGELTGGTKDWFWESVELQDKEPHPRVHSYRAQGVINRKVAESSVNATAAFFGKVESIRDFVEIETGNQSKRRGEEFLGATEIAACVDKELSNQASGMRPGVGFLDLSNVRDVTSLVICEDRSRLADADTPAEPAWTRIVTARIDVFAPLLKNHDIVSGGFVDDVKLEEYLDQLIPTFKLLRLRIDDRNDEKWRRMVARLRKKDWGRIVIGCAGTVKVKEDETDHYTDEDRRFAWIEVERRFLGKTIRIQDRVDLRKELVGARTFRDSRNREEVRESGSRSKKGVRHLDVAEALAGCCFDIQGFATKPKGPGLAAVTNRASGIAAHLRRLAQSRDDDPKRPMARGLGEDSY